MRKTFVIFSLILLAVSLIGGVSAANTCLNSNDILLKLSSETNAHGSTLTSSYPEEICYSQFFTPSVSGASRGCSGLNKIVELSGSTNAHAQIPGGSGSYGTSICYEGLNCAAQTTDCVLPAKEIISISANTNAHLGIAGTYTKKICCSVGAAAPECSSYLDCPGQFCNTGTRTCMDCLRDADCSGGQYCDVGVTNTCVDCTQGDQCPSGDCNTATNTCAPTSSIAFWSNAEGVSVEDNDFFNATEKNPYMRVENGGAYKQVEFKIYESDGDGDDDRDILREDIFVTLDRDGNALIALNADIQFMSDAYSLEEELLVWDEEPEIVFEAIEKSLGGVVATSGAMEIISSRPAEGLSCASYNDSKDDCDDCDNFQNDHVQGSFENGEFDIMLEELEKVHEVEMECEKPIAVDPDVYGGCDRAKVECFCLYNETLTECLPRVGIDLLCGGNCGDGEVFEEVCDPSTQRSEWA
ncbi:hypothetical protein KAR91_65295, partial [Candidatus Pacearchaeota archaeon]|nr:hypothetical protein [Candidatus Pacearchaeota archaeon]